MPRLSLCVPTWNRADLLEHTVGRIFDAYGDEVEVVIADNSSTDRTAEVARAFQAKHQVQYVCHRQVLPYLGQSIAMRNATCPLVAFLADDDWILPSIWDYVRQMEERPELTAVYSDLIAWNDEEEKEIHRYFYLQHASDFAFNVNPPLALTNFIVNCLIYPEIGVFRREAFVRADAILARGNLPNHLWMYQLYKQGTIRFEASANAYYQENRVLKPQFRRNTPMSGMSMRIGYIGDELRNVLETMWLWALRDSGEQTCPDYAHLTLRRAIEKFLHMRLDLEINRSIAERDGLSAAYLGHRQKLWMNKEVARYNPMDAAGQHVMELARNLGADSLCFAGFTFPIEAQGIDVVTEPRAKTLTVFARDEGQRGTGMRVFLDRLLEMYRV